MRTKLHIAIIIFLVFLGLGMLTNSHYGISWDEPTHFKRGQAYLHRLLTGENTYKSLPPYDLDRAKTDPSYHERSYYQIESFNYDYWIQGGDGEHPILNDVLASAFNYVFYQKLGWLGDIESYHLFEIFVSALLVALVFYWAAEAFGFWAGIASAAFMAAYPLFWAESHFNIKDPIETAFFAFTLYFLWKAINKKKVKYIVISSIFAGVALSIKFNILFIPFIILPWFISLFVTKKREILNIISSKKFIISFVLFPIIMFGIFFAHWPWLRQDFVENTKGVFGYYKEIGRETVGWSGYALQWITFTTQPIILAFLLIGMVVGKKRWRQKSNVFVLWLAWFLVPILRVTVPGTTIYGGVRQIMEYIPALALIAGLGLGCLIQNIRYKIPVLFVTFCLLLIPIFRLHPNENVYFNFLIGGLKGAVEKGIPSAGFSFGNAYWQGVQWLDENAPEGSKLALIQGTNLNVPLFMPRPDIAFSNFHWSGIEREGEYLMELTYNSELRVYHYAWEYVEEMLEPVYEVKADGVPILTVWKNDLEHTMLEFRREENVHRGPRKVTFDKDYVEIEFPEKVILTRMSFTFIPQEGCYPVTTTKVQTSLDGQIWKKEKDEEPFTQMIQRGGPRDDFFQYFFAARPGKFIRIAFGNENSCALINPQIELRVLE